MHEYELLRREQIRELWQIFINVGFPTSIAKDQAIKLHNSDCGNIDLEKQTKRIRLIKAHKFEVIFYNDFNQKPNWINGNGQYNLFTSNEGDRNIVANTMESMDFEYEKYLIDVKSSYALYRKGGSKLFKPNECPYSIQLETLQKYSQQGLNLGKEPWIYYYITKSNDVIIKEFAFPINEALKELEKEKSKKIEICDEGLLLNPDNWYSKEYFLKNIIKQNTGY